MLHVADKIFKTGCLLDIYVHVGTDASALIFLNDDYPAVHCRFKWELWGTQQKKKDCTYLEA